MPWASRSITWTVATTSWRTGSSWTPARTPASTVIVRSPSMRVKHSGGAGRIARHEVRDRDGARGGLDPQVVEGCEGAAVLRQAQADVDRVVGSGRPEVGELEAVCDELNHATDLSGRKAVLGGAAAVDLELPVDAGGRQAVGDVDDVVRGAKPVGDGAGGVVQARGVIGGQTDLDGLAGRRAGVRDRDLDLGAGYALHVGTEVVEDRVGVVALAPVDELGTGWFR